MKKQFEELPLVIRNCIKGLSDEKRQSILIYLLREGPKSFIDICNEFNISKSNLSHHLKVLVRYGLLYNYYNKNEFNDKYSFYKISNLGKYIITMLKGMFKPLKPILTEAHGVPIPEYPVNQLGTTIEYTHQSFSESFWSFYSGAETKKKRVISADKGFIDQEQYLTQT